jgi:hypothetical protein
MRVWAVRLCASPCRAADARGDGDRRDAGPSPGEGQGEGGGEGGLRFVRVTDRALRRS